jgi:maltose O-acetyltransferase
MRLSSLKNSWKERKKHFPGIHPSVTWGNDTIIYGLGEIFIGEGTYIGQGCYILAHPEGIKLIIGKHCAISHNVHIRTEINKKKLHYKDDIDSNPTGADVKIGDYVWIGANVFIRGGIKIGDNSVIGANSVVTHNIPPNSVYGGVPAKLIHKKSEYKEKTQKLK